MPPWTCPDCGERIEGQFRACWNCAGDAAAAPPSEPAPGAPPPRIPRTVGVAILLLLALGAGLVWASGGGVSGLPVPDRVWLTAIPVMIAGLALGGRRSWAAISGILFLGAGVRLTLLFLVTIPGTAPPWRHVAGELAWTFTACLAAGILLAAAAATGSSGKGRGSA